MTSNKENIPVNRIGVLILVFLNAVIAKVALIRNENWYWILVVTMPLLLVAIWDTRRKKHMVPRHSDVPGDLHYFFGHKAE